MAFLNPLLLLGVPGVPAADGRAVGADAKRAKDLATKRSKIAKKDGPQGA